MQPPGFLENFRVGDFLYFASLYEVPEVFVHHWQERVIVWKIRESDAP
jgi:hypothetical protein